MYNNQQALTNFVFFFSAALAHKHRPDNFDDAHMYNILHTQTHTHNTHTHVHTQGVPGTTDATRTLIISLSPLNPPLQCASREDEDNDCVSARPWLNHDTGGIELRDDLGEEGYDGGPTLRCVHGGRRLRHLPLGPLSEPLATCVRPSHGRRRVKTSWLGFWARLLVIPASSPGRTYETRHRRRLRWTGHCMVKECSHRREQRRRPPASRREQRRRPGLVTSVRTSM